MCQNDEGPENLPMVETSGQKNMFEGLCLRFQIHPQSSGEEVFGCLGYDQTKHSVAMSCVCSQPR